MTVSLSKFLSDVHARGYRILEHPKYGGVSRGHMRGSMHFLGRAGDINWGPPGAPASERAELLWVCRLAEAAGLNVIYAYYRTHPNATTNRNHRDHAHVDDSPLSKRALKPRAGRVGDALYARILAEKPLGGSGKKRKPHAVHTVRLGDRNDWAVKLWQQFLNAANKAGLKVDGDFGPATERETKQWQRKAGLVADGIVGRKTWFRAAWGVSLGDKGTRVKIAQRVMGFTGKDVDGKFGPATHERAKEVQRYVGVVPDGDWGPKTIDAMLRKG